VGTWKHRALVGALIVAAVAALLSGGGVLRRLGQPSLDSHRASREQRSATPFAPAPLPAPSAAAAGASLRGIVYGPRGPLAGASVTLFQATDDDADAPADGPCGPDTAPTQGRVAELASKVERGEEPLAIAATTTDAQGRYDFGPVPGGAYALWAEAPEGIAADAGDVTGRNVDLHLAPARWIRGRVLDERAQPLPGARLAAVAAVPGARVEATADGQGTFALGPLASVNYEVVAMSQGRRPAEYVLNGVEDAPVVLRLHPPIRLSGRVVRGVSGAAHAAVCVETGEVRAATEADGSGHFELDGLLPGDATAVAVQGEDRADAALRLAQDEPAEVVLRLEATATISGSVHDERGQAIPDVQLQLTAGEGPRSMGQVVKLEPDGSFRVSRVTAGPVRLFATAKGFHRHRAERSAAAGAETRIDIILTHGVAVEGSVVDPAGKPVAAASVSAYVAEPDRPDNDSFAGSTDTDAAGAFSVSVDHPGAYELRVTDERFRTAAAQARAPGQGVRIVVEPGVAIAGVLVDAQGKPCPSAEVSAYRTGTALDEVAAVRAQVTDERGEFTLQGLDPGSYVVTATLTDPGGDWFASIAVDAPAARAVLRFERRGQISGRVVDASSKPVASAEVIASTDEDPNQAEELLRGRCNARIVTDAQGRFTLTGLRDAEFELSVRSDGYRQENGHAPLKARPGGAELVVRLRRMPMIRGRVLNAGGIPLDSFFADNEPVENPEGKFEISADEPGERTMVFAAQGAAPVTRVVQVGDADVDLGDVVLGAGRTVSGSVVEAATGRPVSHAQIRLVARADAERATPPPSAPEAETDGGGRFEVRHADPGPLSVAVDHPEFIETLQPLEGDSIQIPLHRGGALKGTVLDTRGAGVRAEVVLLPESAAAAPRQSGSGDDGAFRIAGLTPGEYRVALVGPGGFFPEYTAAEVTLREGETSEVVLRPREGGAKLTVEISGLAPARDRNFAVLVPGAAPPPENANDLLRLARRGVLVMENPGRFIFPAMGRGTYTLIAGMELDSHRATAATWPLQMGDADQVIRLQFPAGAPVFSVPRD